MICGIFGNVAGAFPSSPSSRRLVRGVLRTWRNPKFRSNKSSPPTSGISLSTCQKLLRCSPAHERFILGWLAASLLAAPRAKKAAGSTGSLCIKIDQDNPVGFLGVSAGGLEVDGGEWTLGPGILSKGNNTKANCGKITVNRFHDVSFVRVQTLNNRNLDHSHP